MLYVRPSFTCPAAGLKTSDTRWDLATLSEEDFSAKYGKSKEQVLEEI